MLKKLIPFAIAVVLIVIIGAFWLLPEYREKTKYSTAKADLNEYFQIYSDTEVPIMLQDELIEERAQLIDGVVYVDSKFVNKYFTDRFYYNNAESVLLYTTATDVVTVGVNDGSTSYFVGDKEVNVGYQIAFTRRDSADNTNLYVALDYVKNYANFEYELFSNPNRMQLYTKWGKITTATISKDTDVRTLGGIKSPILTTVAAGTKVTVLNKMETWTEIKTPDAIKGYVETKYLNGIADEQQAAVTDFKGIHYANNVARDHTICLGWQYVGNQSANDNLAGLVKKADGLNTVSPTWFFIKDNEGTILDLGSKAYVDKAHQLGLEVWALIEDITYKSKFQLEVVLGTSEKRAALIDKLMAAAEKYGLDGLNIDFEGVVFENAPHYLQFLRELSIRTHEAGIVLSVDIYMPVAKNEAGEYVGKTDYMSRRIGELGIVADYVILMGYDEHWSGCPEAGSVASLPFVRKGIEIALKREIPNEKLINAIPFYTRVWETKGGTVKDTTDNMINAAQWVSSRGVTLTWDSELCQNYGELKKGDTTYQIWMEDTESIQAKLNLMLDNNLAGVACWQLGYEDPAVWPLLQGYVESNVVGK